jgi:hypothetical protein
LHYLSQYLSLAFLLSLEILRCVVVSKVFSKKRNFLVKKNSAAPGLDGRRFAAVLAPFLPPICRRFAAVLLAVAASEE